MVVRRVTQSPWLLEIQFAFSMVSRGAKGDRRVEWNFAPFFFFNCTRNGSADFPVIPLALADFLAEHFSQLFGGICAADAGK